MKKKEFEGTSAFEEWKTELGWKLYELRRKLFHRGEEKPKKEKTMAAARKASMWFCIVMLAIPVLQFFVFYICVNFNSFLLVLQRFTAKGTMKWASPWYDNFSKLFEEIAETDIFKEAFKNSFIAYLFTVLLATPVTLLFAFYIYKKAIGSTFFKVMLFLPSVISSVVLIAIFTKFVDEGSVLLFPWLDRGIYSKYKFETILFYNVWIGFGGTILMYLSAMNSINESLVEAAQLEGCNYLQEFVHITFPMIYTTFTTFFIVGIAGFFTNQLNELAFFGASYFPPDGYTIGFMMYQRVADPTSKIHYPTMAALGLMITVVVAPLTLWLRSFLEKVGPSAER